MQAKTFEIRDRASFVPVLCVKLEPGCEADRYLFARAGYGRDPENQRTYVMMMGLAGGVERATSDPHEWPGDTRTRPVAHDFITKHFDELPSGAVIDVEFILQETTEPKKSEALDYP